MRRRHILRALVAAGALVGAVACGGGSVRTEAMGPGPALGVTAPDFELPDVNPGSATFDADVSPRDHVGAISAWYFAHATCAYCRAQLGHLDRMLAEPALAGLPRAVRILGVNSAGHEVDNALACAGRTIPWLQDDGATDAWGRWDVTFRDVVILDAANEPIAIYNLTAHDLGDPASYDELLDVLVDAASAP